MNATLHSELLAHVCKHVDCRGRTPAEIRQRFGFGNGSADKLEIGEFILDSSTQINLRKVTVYARLFLEDSGFEVMELSHSDDGMSGEFKRGNEVLKINGERLTDSSIRMRFK